MDIKEQDADISFDPIDISNTEPTYSISSISSDSACNIDYSSLQSVIGGATVGALGPNSIYTTGTGGYNWNITSTPTTISNDGRMSLHGKNADIEINGRSMSDWMAKVEERLNILTTNPNLEKEWDDLHKLGERYRELEKKCKEKAEMWKKLKSMPAPKPERF
jgi:hypothetical protein